VCEKPGVVLSRLRAEAANAFECADVDGASRDRSIKSGGTRCAIVFSKEAPGSLHYFAPA
jgi:hypothetical protein